MKNRGTLILTGLGLNCERETAHCCAISGASRVDQVHTLDFLRGTTDLMDYDLVIFIGGFLDGDYLGSARVGVNRFKFGTEKGLDLKEKFRQYLDQDRLILGICNGFQFLVKLGLLPDDAEAFDSQSVSLTQNANARFEDRWVHLKVNPGCNNHFLKGMDRIELPVRHGEGRIVVQPDVESKILDQNLIAMTYTDLRGMSTDQYPMNPNGSWMNVAALSNPKGTLLGLMPHPEAFNHPTNHPRWTRLAPEQRQAGGLLFFSNAYQYLSQ